MPLTQTQAVSIQPRWQSPVRYLKGVGPEKQKLLARLGIEKLSDLFTFFPRRYEKRFPVKGPRELSGQDKECVRGTVLSRSMTRRGGLAIFRAVLGEGAERLEAIYYRQPFLMDVFLPETKVLLYGKAERQGRRWRMVHPEYEALKESGKGEPVHMAHWTPVYPLTEDLSQKTLRGLIARVLKEQRSLIKEPWSDELRRRRALVPLAEALQNIHFPKDVAALKAAYRRLVFDEFFRLETELEKRKARLKKEDIALSHRTGAEMFGRWMRTLDIRLTVSQKRALEEILADMRSGRVMHRLLQGDVGSGKTVVAAGALYFTVLNGFQGALMAPTEVLAQQLYFQMKRFLEAQGVRLAYVAQGAPEPAEGTQVFIGTHALLKEDLRFANLGLAIVDEQHKFGVFQREALKNKGPRPAHFLLMTATPIPRTLCMTFYGDLDITTLEEKPAGRGVVRTFWVEPEKRPQAYQWLEGQLGQGAQAYIICPLVDDVGSPLVGDRATTRVAPTALNNAVHMKEKIQAIFAGRRIGLLHGRMKSDQKKVVMQEFKNKQIEVLVSTVVVEVGVDVPNARCMIIENAERFGLAQLHQLRGRIGRSAESGVCLLFSEAKNEEAVQRLTTFQNNESGFAIAEEDLKQRGAGEYFGSRQHGDWALKIGDLIKDADLFLAARDEAQRTA